MVSVAKEPILSSAMLDTNTHKVKPKCMALVRCSKSVTVRQTGSAWDSEKCHWGFQTAGSTRTWPWRKGNVWVDGQKARTGDPGGDNWVVQRAEFGNSGRPVGEGLECLLTLDFILKVYLWEPQIVVGCREGWGSKQAMWRTNLDGDELQREGLRVLDQGLG